jgi:hypothetical protein
LFVGSLEEIRIIEVHAGMTVSNRGQRNDSRVTGSAECWKQTHSQREMPKVIHAEMSFESIGGAPQGVVEHAGIVDQQMQRPLLFQEFGNERVYRAKRGKIKVCNYNPRVISLRPQCCGHRIGFAHIAGSDDDARTSRRECPHCLGAEAR